MPTLVMDKVINISLKVKHHAKFTSYKEASHLKQDISKILNIGPPERYLNESLVMDNHIEFVYEIWRG